MIEPKWNEGDGSVIPCPSDQEFIRALASRIIPKV